MQKVVCEFFGALLQVNSMVTAFTLFGLRFDVRLSKLEYLVRLSYLNIRKTLRSCGNEADEVLQSLCGQKEIRIKPERACI